MTTLLAVLTVLSAACILISFACWITADTAGCLTPATDWLGRCGWMLLGFTIIIGSIYYMP